MRQKPCRVSFAPSNLVLGAQSLWTFSKEQRKSEHPNTQLMFEIIQTILVASYKHRVAGLP